MHSNQWLFMLCTGLLLAACDVRTPEYPARGQKKFTEVTISADGKLLAVLENKGTAQAKLLTRRLDQDTRSWQELPLPVFTSSVRFGLEGQALLLTHDLPEDDDMRQLIRWDLADLQKNSEVIYQGPFLAFPIEARPVFGQVVPAKNYPKSDVNSCRDRYAFGTYWMLVRDQNTPPVRLTPDDVKLTFSQPSVTPQGVFWVTENIKERGDFSKGNFGSPGMLSSFLLPNGKAPTLSEEVVKTSTDVVCDRGMVRCIRQYNAGTDRKTLKFMYRLEVVLGTQRCELDDLIGYGGLVSFTPNGLTAVAPLPPTDALQRRVAVIRFAPGSCEPLSVQQFNIEET